MKQLLFVYSFLFFLAGCHSDNDSTSVNKLVSKSVENTKQNLSSTKAVEWTAIKTDEVKKINSDLKIDELTVDIGIYLPSNFDTGFKKIDLNKLLEGIKAAKEIYTKADVQINLLWIKIGKVDPKFLSIASNKAPAHPGNSYINAYRKKDRFPSMLSKDAETAFESIIEQDKNNYRTVYIVALQDVFFSFFEKVAESPDLILKTGPTGGLSFPPYIYGNNIPKRLRGVFTVCNLSEESRVRKTIAHELGHKIINVSHEYRHIAPGHEVRADGGLMVYGSGEEIPSGREGRWHKERLHLSPFLYRLNEGGEKQWNADYKEGGHYYDPLYGDKVIEF